MREITVMFLAFFGLFILLACEDESENESTNCMDKEFYLSFTANGVDFCYPDCSGNLFEIPYGDSTKYRTSVGAGEVYSEGNDTIWLFPSFTMQFTDTLARTYDNNDIYGLSFFAQFDYEEGSFFFPSLFHDHKSEYFELSVAKYDMEKNCVTGTFHGITFNSVNNTDSIVIENGKFTSQLFKFAK